MQNKTSYHAAMEKMEMSGLVKFQFDMETLPGDVHDGSDVVAVGAVKVCYCSAPCEQTQLVYTLPDTLCKRGLLMQSKYDTQCDKGLPRVGREQIA
ncbi:hypothetical protein [Pseudodesulfovibrio sp.]|uniref:hypothetical protein n=1 Tax=unclassified Pseudodesulfovibrio TaxID=2661612 RepID=UPI003AFFFF7B